MQMWRQRASKLDLRMRTARQVLWTPVCSSSVEAATWRSIPSAVDSDFQNLSPDLVKSITAAVSELMSDCVSPTWSVSRASPTYAKWQEGLARETTHDGHDGEPLVSIHGWLELWLLCMVCVFVKHSVLWCHCYSFFVCLFACLFISLLCIPGPMWVSHMINQSVFYVTWLLLRSWAFINWKKLAFLGHPQVNAKSDHLPAVLELPTTCRKKWNS